MPKFPRPIAAALLALCLASSPVAADTPSGGLPVHGLQLPATLTGTLPCADCAGIRHRLDLWPDQVFTLGREWLGHADGPLTQDTGGRWHADPLRGAIVLQGSEEMPRFWQVMAPDRLRQMDMDGNPIVSELDYELTAEGAPEARPGLSLTGVYWQITEIGGAAAPALPGRPAPYLVLLEDGQRLAATLGCNRMIGGYALEGAGLRFTQIASTRMACPPPLDTAEQAFAATLEAVRGYRMEGLDLHLLDDEGRAMTRLRAVWLP